MDASEAQLRARAELVYAKLLNARNFWDRFQGPGRKAAEHAATTGPASKARPQSPGLLSSEIVQLSYSGLAWLEEVFERFGCVDGPRALIRLARRIKLAALQEDGGGLYFKWRPVVEILETSVKMLCYSILCGEWRAPT